MPTAYEMRAAAWRKMKEGGLLPLLAGFSLVMLLVLLVDSAVNWFCLSRGWVKEVSVFDLVNAFGLADPSGANFSPEQEQVLRDQVVPYLVPAGQAVVLLVDSLWQNGVLAFGCAVLAVSAMRGGAKALLVLSGFRGAFPLRAAALGFVRLLAVGLGLLLLVVPGVLAAYSFRMAFMLLADNPDWSAVRALKESTRLMRGHRWRLFCLDASFFGWFLLVGVTRGLAGLFVLPYYATAVAAFYENLLDRTDR